MIQVSLPTSSDFKTIASTPGCLYIDRLDWVKRQYGVFSPRRRRPLIPIIRCPAGYGKTTFLSTFSSYFDSTVDRRLLPLSRFEAYTPPKAIIVYRLDFAELRLAHSEDMSDDEIGEECLRVMWNATRAFLEYYGPKLQRPIPDLDVVKKKHPYEVARVRSLPMSVIHGADPD